MSTHDVSIFTYGNFYSFTGRINRYRVLVLERFAMSIVLVKPWQRAKTDKEKPDSCDLVPIVLRVCESKLFM